MRQEMVVAVKVQFEKLKEQMGGRQLVYGELQFFRGMFVGQGAAVEEVDAAVSQLHEAGELPNIFDMIDDQDKELLRVRGVHCG